MATLATVCVKVCVVYACVCVCVYDCRYSGERAAGVTAPLPKVTSKESRANYYADQSWWRLRGLLRCNHISWPERNLQADPNHRGYSGGVSQDGGLPPMFSFHKTLFPYLEQARDYQAKQPPSSSSSSSVSSTLRLSYGRALAYVCFGRCVRIQYTAPAFFWQTDARADNAHSWPQLSANIYSHFFLPSPSLSPPAPLFLSHSSFRWTPVCDPPRSWRADCNLLSPRGWGVCVQVVNMPPLSPSSFFLSLSPPSLFSLCCTHSFSLSLRQ